MKAAVLLLAGGAGKRFSSSNPKQFSFKKGRPLLDHVLEVFLKEERVKEIAVALPPDKVEKYRRAGSSRVRFVSGGKRRRDSVLNAAAGLSDCCDYVLIHDVSRPFLDPVMLKYFIDHLRGRPALIFGRPLSDTLKKVSGNRITGTVSRESLWLAETPQAFRRDVFERIVDFLARKKADFTDDSSIAEQLGVPVRILKTPGLNFKITYPEDAALLRRL
ncbi:MAG TPA: 2-C-methyl-D-erythritol 4-phosphate cytidylyltransferase [bacterium]|nr:2-C-methyl-D-erythritol 4-phosphate cytidylyltransferase [bacterium]